MTSGLLTYRYQKRCYNFYNDLDSYPEGLGEAIVKSVPEDEAEYGKWLESKRAFFASWEKILEEDILIITMDHLFKLAQTNQLSSESVQEELILRISLSSWILVSHPLRLIFLQRITHL